jgi:Flp pilus assembly protein TadB
MPWQFRHALGQHFCGVAFRSPRWHEKFEKQRQQLQSAEVQQESQASGTSPQSQNQQPDHKVSTQQQQQQQQQGARRPLAAFLQYSQLAVVLAALILWPAATQPGGLYCLRVWVLYLLYFNFFAASVARNLKHGPLTDR